MNEVKKFSRSKTDKVIAGVCGGLGQYLDVDPLVFRITFVLLGVFGGSGVVAYLIFWLLIPFEGSESNITQEDIIKDNADEMKEQLNNFTEHIQRTQKTSLPGLIFLVIGIMLALTNLNLVGNGLVIPAVFVVVGLYLLVGY